MIVSPAPLTWSRLRRMWSREKTLLREMEHEIFETIVLNGRCIDVGGGGKASYLGAIRNNGTLYSINIDPKIRPSVIGDLNAPFPFADSCFDAAICFNTLEHLENDMDALAEIIRVLKPGATFHIVVPFLYQVHGAPSDFHRHTFHEWNRRLIKLGFAEESYVIQPLIWDAVATAYSVLEIALPKVRWLGLRWLSLLPGYVYFRLRQPTHGWSNVPLGYYIKGTKPGRPDERSSS